MSAWGGNWLVRLPDLPLFRLANFPGIVIVREDLQPFFKREIGFSVTFRRAELVS